MSKKRSGNRNALDDMVFSLSGKFSRPTELVADIEASGGTVKSSVTKQVTHLLTDGTARTKKLDDARKDRVAVVGENWLEARIGRAENETGGTKRKKYAKAEDDGDGDGDDKGGFEGKVFALSGKFRRVKAEIISDIVAAGGVVKSSVTKDVTHLVTNEPGGVKKVEDLKARGVVVIDEEWVEAQLGGKAEEAPASKGTKRKKPEEDEDGDGLEGKIFALSGEFSRVEAEIMSDTEDAGGVVKSSVTKGVTHLVTNEAIGTKKCSDARARGVSIVDEEWVVSRLGKSESPAKGVKRRKKEDRDEEENNSLAEGRLYMREGTCVLSVPERDRWILDGIGEDDPGFLVDYDPDNLVAFANALTTANVAGNNLFPTQPFTPSSVKSDLMRFLSVNQSGGHQAVRGVVICPNTMAECGFILQRCTYAMYLAGTLNLGVLPQELPLGRVYMLADKENPCVAKRYYVAQFPAPFLRLFE